MYFMDFKFASEDENIKKWLLKPQFVHAIGAVYYENISLNSLALQVPMMSFDGVIFLSETSASVGI